MSASTRNIDINTASDFSLPQSPSDSVSCLEWSPSGKYLAVSSWDNSVRVYEVNAALRTAQGCFVYHHEAPALAVKWWPDESKVVSGGGDKCVRCYDINSGQCTVIGQHDLAVMDISIVDVGQPMVASISLDRTLRYWNLQSMQPVATLSLPERGFHMDSAQKLLVVACANRQIVMVNLDTPQQIFKQIESPLKFQTESVACLPTGAAFAVGSVEGRCGIQYVQQSATNTNFTFRCHRKTVGTAAKPVDEVYAVTCLRFHPQSLALATAGSDGVINTWDTVSRRRLGHTKPLSEAITSTSYHPQGTLMAYALGYDWSKGHQYAKPGTNAQIMIHSVEEWEARGRPRP